MRASPRQVRRVERPGSLKGLGDPPLVVRVAAREGDDEARQRAEGVPLGRDQPLRLEARSQPARLHHGHGRRQLQARARGVAAGVDTAGDAGDGRVLPSQDGVGGGHGAPELGHGLLREHALEGGEARDDDGLAAEREGVGRCHCRVREN